MKRNNIKICRSLRKNQTDTEQKLWFLLRSRRLNGIKFRRQHPVDNYILDFYCPKYKLCIESDGGQHYEDEEIKKDKIRTKVLSKYGIKVIRFSNKEILENIEGIYKSIEDEIKIA
ncbi:MAG: endonuclease domain-containing protein [Candidatus Zapsychrus exili]|nr:endonuclease domain-containing protein [Candidatus Zapsychrus exili]